jgi:hypothetical protein
MKKIFTLTLLLTILFITSYGQETVNNFQVDNSEIIWQKVFETPLTFEDLTEKVKDSGLLDKMEIGNKKITGDLNAIDANFKGAGFTEMGTPMYISRSHFSGFTILEYKDGKYRLTLKQIELTQKYSDPLTKQGEITKLEFFGLKNGKNEMTSAFKRSPSLILNHTFTNKFDFKDTQSKDDW